MHKRIHDAYEDHVWHRRRMHGIHVVGYTTTSPPPGEVWWVESVTPGASIPRHESAGQSHPWGHDT